MCWLSPRCDNVEESMLKKYKYVRVRVSWQTKLKCTAHLELFQTRQTFWKDVSWCEKRDLTWHVWTLITWHGSQTPKRRKHPTTPTTDVHLSRYWISDPFSDHIQPLGLTVLEKEKEIKLTLHYLPQLTDWLWKWYNMRSIIMCSQNTAGSWINRPHVKSIPCLPC